MAERRPRIDRERMGPRPLPLRARIPAQIHRVATATRNLCMRNHAATDWTRGKQERRVRARWRRPAPRWTARSVHIVNVTSVATRQRGSRALADAAHASNERCRS